MILIYSEGSCDCGVLVCWFGLFFVLLCFLRRGVILISDAERRIGRLLVRLLVLTFFARFSFKADKTCMMY